MPEVANNQSNRPAELFTKAVDLLRELFDQHTAAGTYGKAGVEITFEAGKALYVRRTLDATHK